MSNPSTSKEVASKISTDFNDDVIKEVLKGQFSNPKAKITDEAVHLISELAKVIVIEASARAAQQASVQERTTITLDNVESILLQLMLDFP